MCLLLGLICWSHVRGGNGIGCNPKLMLQLPWKMKVLVAQLCPTLWDPIDQSLPGSSLHGLLQARILEWVAIPFYRGSSLPRDWTRVSHIAGKFFTAWATREILTYNYNLLILFRRLSSVQFSRSVLPDSLWPQGLKPARLICPWNSPGKNSRLGSHSLLHEIFPTQGSNPCLLHCRQVLYHPSHQGSPPGVCVGGSC